MDTTGQIENVFAAFTAGDVGLIEVGDRWMSQLGPMAVEDIGHEHDVHVMTLVSPDGKTGHLYCPRGEVVVWHAGPCDTHGEHKVVIGFISDWAANEAVSVGMYL